MSPLSSYVLCLGDLNVCQMHLTAVRATTCFLSFSCLVLTVDGAHASVACSHMGFTGSASPTVTSTSGVLQSSRIYLPTHHSLILVRLYLVTFKFIFCEYLVNFVIYYRVCRYMQVCCVYQSVICTVSYYTQLLLALIFSSVQFVSIVILCLQVRSNM